MQWPPRIGCRVLVLLWLVLAAGRPLQPAPRSFEYTIEAGGAGKAWTAAEQEAAGSASRLLTQQDPPPQTVYRVAAGSKEPLLVKLTLKYGAKAR